MVQRCNQALAAPYFIRTKETCIDPPIGDLAIACVLGELTSRKRKVFEQHRKHCRYCQACVRNGRTILGIIRRAKGKSI